MTLAEVTQGAARAARRAAQVLVQPRGGRAADLVLRSTGVIALLGIPLTIAFPRLVPLIWLAVVSLPASGPLGPIMPAALEPVVMEAAKYEKPIWVTLVALSTYVYMEYLNWHIYRWVLDRDLLSRFRDHRRVRTAVRYFARYPFATTVVASSGVEVPKATSTAPSRNGSSPKCVPSPMAPWTT